MSVVVFLNFYICFLWSLLWKHWSKTEQHQGKTQQLGTGLQNPCGTPAGSHAPAACVPVCTKPLSFPRLHCGTQGVKPELLLISSACRASFIQHLLQVWWVRGDRSSVLLDNLFCLKFSHSRHCFDVPVSMVWAIHSENEQHSWKIKKYFCSQIRACRKAHALRKEKCSSFPTADLQTGHNHG